jgi:hypothetical protein
MVGCELKDSGELGQDNLYILYWLLNGGAWLSEREWD